MNNIYVIEHSTSQISTTLGFKQILYNSPDFSDASIHNFLMDNNYFIDYDVQALIIPVAFPKRETQYDGFKIGLHIRLTREMGEKILLPILFLSKSPYEGIARDTLENKLSLIALTKGSRIVDYDESSIENSVKIENSIKFLKPLSKEEYKSKFLDQIVVFPPASYGNHSLANQWGALRLDDIAQTYQLRSSSKYSKVFEELYFKYKLAFTQDMGSGYNQQQKLSSSLCTFTEKTDSRGSFKRKEILLIDDESDKGWNTVLSTLFKGNQFQDLKQDNPDVWDQMIETLESTDTSITLPDNIAEYDLILLDFRLLRFENTQQTSSQDVEIISGAKILKTIKAINKGLQVIIFTATNKIWNIDYLLQEGANGFYIKESPEYKSNNQFSDTNYDRFKKYAHAAFRRGYLKDIFGKQEELIEKLDITKSNSSNDDLKKHIELIQNTLVQATDLLLLADTTDNNIKYFAYAFLSLYKVIELLTNEKIIGERRNPNNDNYKYTFYFWQNHDLINYTFKNDNFENNTNIEFEERISIRQKLANVYTRILQKDFNEMKEEMREFHKYKKERDIIAHKPILKSKVDSETCHSFFDFIYNILIEIPPD